MNLKETAEFLRCHDYYLILTHKRPDGDTLGSAAALCSALRRMGKKAYLYDNPEVTSKYAFLSEPYIAPDDFTPGCIAAVDVADEKLFPAGFDGEVNINVDHHPSNTGYARNLLLRADSASCAQIILDLVKELRGDVTEAEAEALYTGLSTDTGCFQYGNTDAAAHEAAAELCRCGADIVKLNQLLFRTVSRTRLMLEGLIYSSMRSYADGRINIAVITLDMLAQSGAKEDDCDDLASLAGKVDGGVVAITVRQMAENHCKVSVRTVRGVDSSAICRVFGGGGHAGAAGCELDGTPDEVAEKLRIAAEEELN